jgi:membrane protease YdiL (CAAX protease family)
MENNLTLKPLNLLESLLYFGLPAVLFIAGFWGLMPWLIDQGMLPYFAYIVGLGVPLIFLFLAAFVGLLLEGRKLSWPTIKKRFRLKRMNRGDWLWSLGALVAGSLVGFMVVSTFSDWLVKIGLIFIPPNLPDFLTPGLVEDPQMIYEQAAGGLQGNWTLMVSMLILFLFNILGEELWWRGLILPRQELAFGQWTWVLHGVMWAFFHIFKWWDVLDLLPITLALSFVASKRKSTTTGIVIHGFTNGIALIPLFLGVVGLIS